MRASSDRGGSADGETSPSERTKPSVLFLCTGNACRSQMAEGWARHLKGDVLTAYSAGTVPKGLNTLAVRVMKEEGVDISEHTSKSLMDLNDVVFDWVVTVCDNARERCPLFPGRSRVIHVGFDDPPRLAERAVTEAEALFHYRRVRDEIRAFIETLPESFETQYAAAQAAREQSKAARRR